MATLPIHTVQHVKSVYNKYQVIAVVFTAMTLLAALLAAVSGFQVAKLRKMQAAEVQAPPPPVKEPAPVDSGLDKKILLLEEQLNSEKTTSRTLRSRVHELEERIAAMKVAALPKAPPVQEKPNPTVKPRVQDVAPAKVTPPTQPAGEEKSVAAPPKTVEPSFPDATSEPAKKPIPTEKNEPQVPPESPAPHTGADLNTKPAEQSSPSVAPPPAQPVEPAMEKNQPAPESVTTPMPDSPPADQGPDVSTDGASKPAPSDTGGATEAPMDSKGQSQTE